MAFGNSLKECGQCEPHSLVKSADEPRIIQESSLWRDKSANVTFRKGYWKKKKRGMVMEGWKAKLSRNKTNKKNEAEDKKLDQDCINKLED